MNNAKEVSATILSQLGGNRFITMTGSHSFSYGTTNGNDYLVFRTRNARKVKAVRITLMPSDTYKMEFIGVKDFHVYNIHEIDQVYCDMLQDIFTEYTGLYTKL